jgi:hypothetical protein
LTNGIDFNDMEIIIGFGLGFTVAYLLARAGFINKLK